MKMKIISHMKVIKMNQNKMLIDYLTMFHEQLDELYKLLQTDINYDKKFEEFVQEVVIKSNEYSYYILLRLIKQTSETADIKELDDYLNEILYYYELELAIKNNEAKQQLQKCINYSKVLEALMLDYLPDIEDIYFIVSTRIIDLLSNLDLLIK